MRNAIGKGFQLADGFLQRSRPLQDLALEIFRVMAQPFLGVPQGVLRAPAFRQFLLRRLEKTGIVNRDCRLSRDPGDQPLGALAEHVALGVPKKRPPITSPPRETAGTAR